MKKLTMMLIALALVLCAVMPVLALDDPKVPGYTNQYVEIKNDVSTTGQFFGHIRAGTNVFSNEVVIIGPMGQLNIPVNPDGSFELTNATLGKYSVFLLDGNGGQYEQSSFTIGAGQTSHLDSEILGYAFSATDDAKQPDVIVVTLATYGDGTLQDVTNEVQQVINEGYRSFYFSNGNPDPDGGIFSIADTLLVSINDPAPGDTKFVHIEYTINDVPYIIDANENDIINI